METIEIEYDVAAAVYFPGQAVSGKVTIRNERGLNALSLKICVHGEARTFWRKFENELRRDKRGRYHRTNEHINLASRINYLEGVSKPWSSLDGLSNKIPAGVNIFPFTFQLPFNSPPSFDGSHGNIRYSVQVELNRPWRFNAEKKRPFFVIPIVDLNTIPQSMSPMVGSTCRHSGLLSHKEVRVRVSVPKRGFVPGELIPIRVHVENHAKRPIFETRARLVQHVHYSSQKEHSHLFPQEHCDKHWEHKRAETRVSEVMKSVRVECCTGEHVELALLVPRPLVCSFKVPIIEVDYCIQVLIGEGDKLKCELPCVIGSVPTCQPLLNVAASQQLPPPPYTINSDDVTTPSAPILEQPDVDEHF